MALRKTFAGVVLAGLLLAAAGCGGEDAADDFTKQANAVCERAERASPALDGSSPKQLIRTIDRLVAASERQAVQMKRLEPPEGRAKDLDALVATFEQRTRLLERVREATRSGGTDGFNLALRENARDGRSTNERADGIARELGLDKCLNNPRGS